MYESAVALEAALGDPWRDASAMSFHASISDDEAERFPDEACAALDAFGLPAFYVPAALGGRLATYDELMQLVRIVARRDLTAIIGHAKTYLGAAGVWVAGNLAQQQLLAERILRGVPVSLALTERAHGSDLVASEVTATRSATEYVLDGEKWLINNATRSGLLTVLARTDPRGGFRGCSLILVDKQQLAQGTFRHLPKIRTLGIRGADISGIAFTGAQVPASAVVGAPGSGLEVALKLLQITRATISGLSLGAADTALRITIDFARDRRLYGMTVAELPHARTTLAMAFADLLVADCLATASTRALQAMPEQMSLYSAISKYQVPSMIEAVLRDLSVILGARYYLRQEHALGMFQKVLRDNALVSLFDGSTIVNLHAFGLQLRGLTVRPSDPRVAAALTLSSPLPALDPSQLAVTARTSAIAGEIATAADRLGADAPAELHELITSVARELAAIPGRAAALHASAPDKFSRSPQLFELARRYAAMHAGACATELWLRNRGGGCAGFRSGSWLVVGLSRLLRAVEVAAPEVPPAHLARAFEHMIDLHDRNALFSIRDLALAPR